MEQRVRSTRLNFFRFRSYTFLFRPESSPTSLPAEVMNFAAYHNARAASVGYDIARENLALIYHAFIASCYSRVESSASVKSKGPARDLFNPDEH